MMVRTDNFAQRRRERRSMRICLFHAANHFLEPFYFGFQSFAAGFRAVHTEAKLKILLIADKHVRDARDLAEYGAQLLFTPLPEGCAIIQIERNSCAVLLRGAR